MTTSSRAGPSVLVMALLLATPPSLARSAVRAVRAWPVASQQQARRNAMLACTSLTQRRMERQEVEDFLRSLQGEPRPQADVAHG